jgi:hypothetical protein
MFNEKVVLMHAALIKYKQTGSKEKSNIFQETAIKAGGDNIVPVIILMNTI